MTAIGILSNHLRCLSRNLDYHEKILQFARDNPLQPDQQLSLETHLYKVKHDLLPLCHNSEEKGEPPETDSQLAAYKLLRTLLTLPKHRDNLTQNIDVLREFVQTQDNGQDNPLRLSERDIHYDTREIQQVFSYAWMLQGNFRYAFTRRGNVGQALEGLNSIFGSFEFNNGEFDIRRWPSFQKEMLRSVDAVIFSFFEREPKKTDSPRTDLTASRKPLGEGAWGKVYNGYLVNNEVAFKVLKFDRLFSRVGPNSRNELYQELNQLLNLREHPNLIRYYQIYIPSRENTKVKGEGSLKLVMERMFTSLDQVVQQEGGFNVVGTLTIVSQILNALSYLHSAFVLHGDLKLKSILLNNLFLTGAFQQDAKKIVVKVTDYGLNSLRRELSGSNQNLPLNTKKDIYDLGKIIKVLDRTKVLKKIWERCLGAATTRPSVDELFKEVEAEKERQRRQGPAVPSSNNREYKSSSRNKSLQSPGQGFTSLADRKVKQVGFGGNMSVGGGSKVSNSRLSQSFDRRSYNFQQHTSQRITQRSTSMRNSVVFQPHMKARFSFLETIDGETDIDIAAKVVKVARFFPEDSELQLRCLNAVRVLASIPEEEDRPDKLLRMGAGKIALIALQNHKEEAAVVESAAKVISMLCYSVRVDPEANARAMMNYGAVDCLITAFNQKNVEDYVVVGLIQAVNALHNGDVDMAEAFARRGMSGCFDNILDNFADNVPVLRELGVAAYLLTSGLNQYTADNPTQTLDYHLAKFPKDQVRNIRYIEENNLVLDFFEFNFPKRYCEILGKLKGSTAYNGLLVDTITICEAALYRRQVKLDLRGLRFLEIGVLELITEVIMQSKPKKKGKNQDHEHIPELIEISLKFFANLAARKKLHGRIYKRLLQAKKKTKTNFGEGLKQILQQYQDESDEDIHFFAFCLINEFVMAKKTNCLGMANKGSFKFFSQGEVLKMIKNSRAVFESSDKLRAINNDLKRAYKGEIHTRKEGQSYGYFPCAAAS
eukprot:snap_masked-scaffold_2-processed-gene-23.32-mRNA-1 protein AED:0.16 eAED:0.02 QI:0/0.5/0.33/1/1/1/3/58/995